MLFFRGELENAKGHLSKIWTNLCLFQHSFPPEPKSLKLRWLVASGGPENQTNFFIIFQITFFRFQPKVRQCMAVYIPRETSQNHPKPASFCLFLGECRRNGWCAPEEMLRLYLSQFVTLTAHRSFCNPSLQYEIQS